jgi:hypothetical protein
MGMDVYGVAPVDEAGEYFRNNVWYWRPLWDFCCAAAPELTAGVNGHYNDGEGLNAEGAEALALVLFDQLASGEVAAYEKAYNERIASIPMDDCAYCNATGIRSDEVGVDMHMPDKALDNDVAIVVGRTHGWCNGCQGYGKSPSWEANYPFTEENVREFAKFLSSCGGFQIC